MVSKKEYVIKSGEKLLISKSKVENRKLLVNFRTIGENSVRIYSMVITK